MHSGEKVLQQPAPSKEIALQQPQNIHLPDHERMPGTKELDRVQNVEQDATTDAFEVTIKSRLQELGTAVPGAVLIAPTRIRRYRGWSALC